MVMFAAVEAGVVVVGVVVAFFFLTTRAACNLPP
jgi:hypothetical protein